MSGVLSAKGINASRMAAPFDSGLSGKIDLRRQSLAVPIFEKSEVTTAESKTANICALLGFGVASTKRAASVISKLAKRLAHAGGGTLVLRGLYSIDNPASESHGLDILSLDNRPGLNAHHRTHEDNSTGVDDSKSFHDIEGLTDHLDIYARKDIGTVIHCQVWTASAPDTGFDIGAICLPLQGEQLCGDGWSVREGEDGLAFAVIDGLGHGLPAAQASDEALNIFARQSNLASSRTIEAMHEAMRATCGAAVLVGHVQPARLVATCAGIGNIGGAVMSLRKPQGFVSLDGVVGYRYRKVQAFDYEFAPDDIVVLHSDGLKTPVGLDAFPGLRSKSAGIIAGVLYKHCRRGSDDETVLVIKGNLTKNS